MAERISALHGHYAPGDRPADRAGVVLREVRDLNLHQIAAWPDTLAQVGEKAAQGAGVAAAPGPCASAVFAVDGATQSALLRVEPLKWWMLGGTVPRLAPEQGTTLDLSHSRTHLRITGPRAATLLNRHLPLDLREGSFPEGAVGASALHHVGVTLWRSQEGYELFIPRGFALSVWEVLLQTAAQFGVVVIPEMPGYAGSS